VVVRIFHHYYQLPLVLLAGAEALVSVFAFYWVIASANDVYVAHGLAVAQAVFFGLIVFVAMVAVGLYSSRQRSRYLGLFARMLLAIFAVTCFGILLVLLFPQPHLSVAMLAVVGAVVLCAFALIRGLFVGTIDENIFRRRVLVFGAGKRATRIAHLRRRADRRGFTVVGYVPTEGDSDVELTEGTKLDRNTLLPEYCGRMKIDEIVVAMDDRRRHFPLDQLLECRLDGIEITELVGFLERETGKVYLDVLNPSWMIFSTGFRHGYINGLFERCFDVVVSLALLAVTSPLMIITALAIKLEDGLRARIFYSQTRVGQYGHNFELFKFRSMSADAERDGQARWAVMNDARVTRVGALIRKTRIDELPQILNVLRGEMSFVGPRPERPVFVSQLNERIPYYRERHAIKPGVTGWAQLCYPYGSSEQDAIEKLQFDLYYVKNHSLMFYLAVLVQTVEVILWRKGAR